MLAMVRNVRRRLRQQFFRTSGRNRNIRVFLVYEFLRAGVRVLWERAGGRRLVTGGLESSGDVGSPPGRREHKGKKHRPNLRSERVQRKKVGQFGRSEWFSQRDERFWGAR